MSTVEHRPTRLWSVDEVADYLGVPKGTVYQWSVRGGGPPSFRVGRYRKFRPEDIEAWLEEKASGLGGSQSP